VSARPSHALALGLALTVLAAGSWRTMMAPGPVASVHDEWAADCDSCHLVFDGIPDTKCLSCHTGLQARIEAGTGWHAEVVATPCIDCHTDHHGLDGSLTEADALSAFDHASTGFPLEGAHGRPSCDDCHTGSIDQLQQACGGCHDDPHSSALGPDCAACHVPTGFTSQLKALSAHALDMQGAHGEQACDDCHTHGALLSGEVVCADCHDQAHGGTTSSCDHCHEVSGFTPATFDHGPCTCAFPGKHQTAACLDCHTDFDWVNTPTACAGCHTDDRPHDDLGACSTCHTATSWSDGRFDHNRQTDFPITGSHEEVSCTQCHGSEGTFGGLSTACAGCHAEQGAQAHGDFGPCTDCHTPAGFAPSSFDHATTGFPLKGRHTALGCPSCHAPDGSLLPPRPTR
jgi:hypothetical protein